MAGWLKGLLTVIIATVLAGAMLLLIYVAGQIVPWWLLILAGGGFGLLYGLEAGSCKSMTWKQAWAGSNC